MESLFFLLALAAVVAFLIYLASSGDRERVREYLEQEDCKLLSMDYLPFGGGRDGRNYTVRFLDRAGNEHEVTCRTGMWMGVYFTRDRIVREAPLPETSRATELEAENRRLRKELEKLRGSEPSVDSRDA